MVLVGHLVVGDVRPLAPSREGVQLVEEPGLLLSDVVDIVLQPVELPLQFGHFAGLPERCAVCEPLHVLDGMLYLVGQRPRDAPGVGPAVEVEVYRVGARVVVAAPAFPRVVDF